MRNLFYVASLCFFLGCSYSDKEIRNNTSLAISVPERFRVEQKVKNETTLDLILEPKERVFSYPKKFIKITERPSLDAQISINDEVLVGPDGEVFNAPAEPIGITRNLTGNLEVYNGECVTYIGAKVYLK